RVHSTAGVGRLQLSPVLAPQSLEVAPVEHGDDLAVEQAQLPDLLVLAVRVRLPHRRALDVGVGVREVEVGRERLPQAPVVVVLELERVRLVLPGDAVRVEELGHLLLGRMGETRRLRATVVAGPPRAFVSPPARSQKTPPATRARGRGPPAPPPQDPGPPVSAPAAPR